MSSTVDTALAPARYVGEVLSDAKKGFPLFSFSFQSSGAGVGSSSVYQRTGHGSLISRVA